MSRTVERLNRNTNENVTLTAMRAVRQVTLPAIAVRSAMEQAADSAERAAHAQESLARATSLAIKAAKNSIQGFDELHVVKQAQEESGKEKNNSSKKGSSGKGSGSDGADNSRKQQKFPWLAEPVEWDAFWMGIQTLLKPSIDSWLAAFAQIGDAARQAFERIRTAAQTLWEGALGPLLEQIAFGVLPGIVNAVSTMFAPLAGGAGAGILTAFAGAFETLCSVAQNLYQTVLGPVIERVGTALSDVWYTHIAPLFTRLGELLAQAGETISAFWTGVVQPLLNALVDIFGPVVAEVMGAAGDVLAAFLAAASDALNGVIDALSGVLTFLTSIFTGDWAGAWQGIQDVFTGVWSAITSLAKSAVNGIIGCINTLLQGVAYGVNTVANALNSIQFDIPEWVPVFGGQHFALNLPTMTAPQIPYLAKGAVIPPNAAFLAVLGDQTHGRNLEAPEGLLRQIVREETGGTAQFTASQPIELSLDGDVFYRAMMDIQARRGVRMGGVFADAR